MSDVEQLACVVCGRIQTAEWSPESHCERCHEREEEVAEQRRFFETMEAYAGTALSLIDLAEGVQEWGNSLNKSRAAGFAMYFAARDKLALIEEHVKAHGWDSLDAWIEALVKP